MYKRQLQDLLRVCETELAWLNMSLNASKSMSMRIGPRRKHECCELTTMDGHEVLWANTIRYLGVYLDSSKNFSISLDYAKSLTIERLMLCLVKSDVLHLRMLS